MGHRRRGHGTAWGVPNRLCKNLHAFRASMVKGPGRSLREKKCSKTAVLQRPHVARMSNHGWWRLAVGGWRLVAVGGWRLVVGGGWWLAVGGWWRLAAVDDWRLVVGGVLAVGGWWRLVVPGAVLKGGL